MEFCYSFLFQLLTSLENILWSKFAKIFCQFSLKCLLKFFFFKNLLAKPAKVSSKVPTTDTLVYFSEHISRTAILTQTSVITLNRIFRVFLVLVLYV